MVVFLFVHISCCGAAWDGICSQKRLKLFGVWLSCPTHFGFGGALFFCGWWWSLCEPLGSFYFTLKSWNCWYKVTWTGPRSSRSLNSTTWSIRSLSFFFHSLHCYLIKSRLCFFIQKSSLNQKMFMDFKKCCKLKKNTSFKKYSQTWTKVHKILKYLQTYHFYKF